MSIEIKSENKGRLHRALGVKQGDNIPAEKLKIPKGTSMNALKLKKEIVFARNAKKWNHGK